MEEKICKNCKKELLESKNGKLCSICLKEYMHNYYINKRNLVIKEKIPFDMKEYQKEYHKKYRQTEKRKNDLKRYNTNYTVKNSEKIKEKANNKYRDNKDKSKKYYLENKDKIKNYYLKNKDTAKEYNSLYYSKNREKYKEYGKKYRSSKEYKIKLNEHIKTRCKTDPLFKLIRYYRTMNYTAFKAKGYKKNTKSENILGCSFIEYQKHIEMLFETWMTYDNFGLYNGELNYGWDIDHIEPLANVNSYEDLLRICHYTNLRPLCSKINRDIKKNKLDYE